MILVVDAHSGIPVYRQLMEQIRFHVASGLLQAGDEVPSTRGLSAQLGVNPMTISKAYALLEREGVLERRPGRPLVVRPRQEERLHTTRLEQLETSLRPVALEARQLGLDPDDALEVFRTLLGSDEE